MIGQPKTRTEFQQETGLKGKALTAYLKTLVQAGVVIKRLAYAEPSKSTPARCVSERSCLHGTAVLGGAMKKVPFFRFAAVRRLAAWIRMRAIEISLADTVNSMACVCDEETLARMRKSCNRLSIELCRARTHYRSFLPPAQRPAWRAA